MKPDQDDLPRANSHSTNQPCSQTASFNSNQTMNLEFTHNDGVSSSVTTPPVSSPTDSNQNSQLLCNPNNEYPEASRKTPAASNFLVIPQVSLVPQLPTPLVVLGFIVWVAITTIPSLVSDGTNWKLHIEISSGSHQVEKNSESERVNKITKSDPVKKATESK